MNEQTTEYPYGIRFGGSVIHLMSHADRAICGAVCHRANPDAVALAHLTCPTCRRMGPRK